MTRRFPSFTAPFKRSLLTLGGVSLITASLVAQPTTNPVTDSGINVGTYDLNWVNSMPWASVTTTAATADDGVYNADGTISSGDDLAVVQAEIFALSGSGGGVLYFPAGDYDFSDNLYLADGVILRGATPAVSDARGTFVTDGNGVRTYTPNYDPETNFNFPVFIQDFTTSMRSTDPNRAKYFKQINVGKDDGLGGIAKDATNASDYGMVNIDINGAIISISDRNEPSTWGTEIPKNEVTGKNILIFGNRLNNGTALEPSIPRSDQNAWQIWPTRTRGKIDAVTAGNTLIANNLVGDMYYSYYVLGDTNQMIMDYDATNYLDQNGNPITPADRAHFADGYGVRLNHVLDYATAHSAIQEPSKHREGQGIINNWVFATTRVGFICAGNGLIVKGNVREDFINNKLEAIKEDGRRKITNNSATQENRGIDVTGGHDVVIEDNYVRVKRGTFPSGYLTIDGEGILLQESSSTIHPTNWMVKDNTVHSYIGLYRIRSANGITFEGNTVYNDPLYTDGAPNGGIGHVGGTVTFKDNTATSVYAKYNIKPRNFVFDDQGGNSPAATVVEDGNGGGPSGAADVDSIPGIEILYPTKADMASINEGDTITVQVQVIRDVLDVTPVAGVKLWDGVTNYPTAGKIGSNYWDFDGLTAGQPAGIALSDMGGGLYEGSWTVPAEFKARGLLVAEIRLDPQTVHTDLEWIQKNWAFMAEGGGGQVVAPVGVVVGFNGNDVELTFESKSGTNYQILVSTDNMASFVPYGTAKAGTGSSMTMTHPNGKPAAGDKIFYQIEASN